MTFFIDSTKGHCRDKSSFNTFPLNEYAADIQMLETRYMVRTFAMQSSANQLSRKLH